MLRIKQLVIMLRAMSVVFHSVVILKNKAATSTKIYKFQNIRFAAPPVGDLRWAKPAPPPTQSGIVDGSVGGKCPQAAIKGLNIVGTADNSPIAAVIDAFIDDVIEPLFSGGQEDCRSRKPSCKALHYSLCGIVRVVWKTFTSRLHWPKGSMSAKRGQLDSSKRQHSIGHLI